jgi:hypothetical protein
MELFAEAENGNRANEAIMTVEDLGHFILSWFSAQMGPRTIATATEYNGSNSEYSILGKIIS